MPNIPLGVGAYKRQYAGEPEVVLENRYLEKNPTNLREGAALISRPGTSLLNTFGDGKIRRTFSRPGFMGGDLFVISGADLYRYDGTKKTKVAGIINGSGAPQLGWMKGIGYEYLFIADGLLLQFYPGGTHAKGTLTWADYSGAITNQIIKIGSTYYSWANDISPAADGTASHPFLCKLTADPMRSMATMLNFAGISGTDYSASLSGPRTDLTASNDTATKALTLVLTANSVYSDGNSIATTVYSGSYLTWGSATLTGGGTHALSGVTMPDGVGAKALASCSGYVLISVANSQKFFWLEPGSIVIDALNYAEKESHPDNIVDMMEVGDQVLISGDGSTENWYATGDINAPWLPVQGRVYQRGVVPGTMATVQDSVIIVGNDGIVYSIGYGYGESAQWGVHRISDHGVEERIRVQRRREAGLST